MHIHFFQSSHPRCPHNIQSLVLSLWSNDRLKGIFWFTSITFPFLVKLSLHGSFSFSAYCFLSPFGWAKSKTSSVFWCDSDSTQMTLQRVNQCLRDACHYTSFRDECMEFIDCGSGNANEEYGSHLNWANWTQNPNASNCFQTGGPPNGFDYGIYTKAVNLTGKNIIIRYIYSLFWGFQVCE